MNPVPSAINALAQAAVKRRFFTRATATRLIQGATSAGVGDISSLRNWLTKGEAVSPDLGKKLSQVLAPGDGLIYGTYRALAHLADGGMGSVWLAERPGADGLVVVKTMKTVVSGPAGEESLKRFEREARITRQLAHPNVVRCVDSGIASEGSLSTLYLVLEYVDSGDLRDLVDATGGLSEPLALAILLQVADGLAQAHQLHLVHRDIKPGNVFVSSTGVAKLADFGIARSTDTNRTMLTMEGSVVGSPQYMSPEQINAPTEVDIRSDLYALGAMLYFCLAEEPPFGGKLQEILHAQISMPPPDIRAMRPEVSAGTQTIIATCMAKNRAERFQTPAELRLAVAQVLNELGHGSSNGAMSTSGSGSTSTMLREATAALTGGASVLTLGTRITVSDLPTVASDPASGDMPTVAGNTDRIGEDGATMVADLSGARLGDADFHSGSGSGTSDLPTMAMDLTGAHGPGVGDAPTISVDLGGLGDGSISEDPAPPPAASDGEWPTIETAADRLFKARKKPAPLPASDSPVGDFPTIETAHEQAVRAATPTPLLARPGANDLPTIPSTRAGKNSQSTDDLPTMASAGPLGASADHNELATMTAMLLADAKRQTQDPGTGATVLLQTLGERPAVQRLTLAGDLNAALAAPWIALAPAAGSNAQALVLLYAKERISFGKLRDPSVDLCLRNYPIAEHKDACQRISRIHGHLLHDPAGGRCLVEDANAANGTRLDGVTVPPGGTAAIDDDGECVLEIAGAVVLRLRSLPRRGPAVATPAGHAAGAVGLDASAACDAITITRPENRPELAMALVLRRITIGGPGSDLPLAGARTRSSAEIAVVGGRWIWRPSPPADGQAEAWRPLADGGAVTCGGLQLIAHPAGHELYA